jgi:RNA 3'-terminal phosphate cyclase (ATP)
MDQAFKSLHKAGFIPEGETQAVPASGKGTYCFILAEFQNIRVGFSALGELGKRAEQVADESVEIFLRYWERPGALDPHLSDQVILPMALGEGESVISVSEITEHLRTNIWVVEQFLPVTFRIEENPDGAGGRVRVSGCAHRRFPG